ncbi:hypothetical protein FCM35_KLT17730 [Carex littledalei]|uniref:Protein kinase domain-containing protein n=1 Tax=Carex littledalei TaxID=544730 RepID=A0A833RCG7_9POAL|nr:hypothetical protein FCM35_KLT17730 [Carex littledalei]
MGCLICKPIAATSAEDFCFSLFFPTYSGATSAADAQRETSRVDDPLKAPPLQRGYNTSRHVITSPERDRNGWPTWLSAAAGDAVSGWTPRRADSFEKLEKIGSGTYSNVYKAIDLDKRHVVALKKVRIDGVAAVGPGEPQKKATSEAARTPFYVTLKLLCDLKFPSRKARANGSGGYDTVKQVPRLVTSARTRQEKFPPPHLDGSIGHNMDTTSDVSEFFSSTVIELRKDRSRKKSLSWMEHPMRNPSRRKGGTKVRPGRKMAPPILIGGFSPGREAQDAW